MAAQTTIDDVARSAGVSPATVSRALRGLDKVNPDTRERVLKAAAELDYIASPTAASLASGRTRVVGIVTPFMSRWYFATVISAIEKTLRAHGHHVLLMDLEERSYTRRMPLSRRMLFKRVDGIVVLNVALNETECALVEGLHLPVVTVGNQVGRWPWVGIDDVRCAALATEHLIGLGHTDIAYVGAVPARNPHRKTPIHRLQGFRETMAAHDLRVRAEWVVSADWTATGAWRGAVALFAGEHRPTAVVAGSDEMAFGVLAASAEHAVVVPDDLALVGIDDHELSRVLGLTTVRQDVVGQGQAAATAILSRLGYLDAPATENITLPVQLIVRRTTSPQRVVRTRHTA